MPFHGKIYTSLTERIILHNARVNIYTGFYLKAKESVAPNILYLSFPCLSTW